MNAQQQAAATRRGAGLFALADRGLLGVRGGDRVRWLDGMISNEVRTLGPERSGCHASLLTRTGRMVADLHVLWRPEELWLELDAAAADAARSHLEKFIIADDVAVDSRGAAYERLGLEGPAARAVLEAATDALAPLTPHGATDALVGRIPVTVAAYGWSGELAFQLFAPPGSGAALAKALTEAGRDRGLIEAGPEALEILRIEAGIPRLGAELDESVLPDEAGLQDTVSTTKGCYTGQEVVARLRSQGQLSHHLVGLEVEGQSPLPCEAEVRRGEARVGEVTSACVSPAAGAIALAFVRRPHHRVGTEVSAAGRAAWVAALPFVAPAVDGG